MATITDTWDNSFRGSPQGSDSFSIVDDRIRELKRALDERLRREHSFTPGTDNAKHGKHLSGSAVAYRQDTVPTTDPNGDVLSADDDGRLCVSSNNLLVYVHPDWVSLPGLTLLGAFSGTTVTTSGNGVIGGDLQVNGADIGIEADVDLIGLAENALTVRGAVTANSGVKVGSSGTTITQITVS